MLKKLCALLLAVVMIITMFTACGDTAPDEPTVTQPEVNQPVGGEVTDNTPDNDNQTTEPTETDEENATEPEATEPEVTDSEPETPESIIEKVITERIKEKYSQTDIDDITINENLGTEEDGDYIALVYLTWNVKNKAETSKEMLNMYSSDLAATVADKCENVQEIAIFWTVPYLDSSAKCSYERKDGAMYEMDMMWGF